MIILKADKTQYIAQETKINIGYLIRKGLSQPDVTESKGFYLKPMSVDKVDDNEANSDYRACVLGLAFCGLFETTVEAWKALKGNYDGDIVRFLSSRLGIEEKDAEKLEMLHIRGLTAEQIAYKLERGEI